MVSYAFPDADLAGEPTLDELFGDPIVHLMMKRDGVEERDMRGTLERIKDAYHAILERQ